MFSLFKSPKPSIASVLDRFDEELLFTPDAPSLERRSDWLVFVPDEMMSKFPTHPKLGVSRFKVANAAVTEDRFSFWLQDAGVTKSAIPMVKQFKHIPHAQIRGELFLLKTEDVFSLDITRTNGVEYNRVRVKLRLPRRKAKNVQVQDRALYEWALSKTLYLDGAVEAFMYVGNEDFWTPLIDTGTKVFHQDKNGVETLSRINSNGVFRPVSAYKPHNPDLNIYYYFSPEDYGSIK